MRHLIPKKFHKITLAFLVVIIVATITVLVLFVVFPITTSIIQNFKKSADDKYSVLLSDEVESKLQAKSPSSGKLQYEFITNYVTEGQSSTKFIYFTKERRNERLIELTELVMNELRTTNKVTDSTKTFSIDFFDNKTVAKDYFQKVNDPKTKTLEKLELKNSYIASMVYAKDIGLNQLIRISTAQVIKKY